MKTEKKKKRRGKKVEKRKWNEKLKGKKCRKKNI